MKKYSKQRELILNSLKNRCDHPTADMLYMDLKKEMPNIGIATVYRNLVDLQQEKQIIKIKTEDGPDRFDGNLTPHLHLVCEKCNKIEDIFLEGDKINFLTSSIKESILGTKWKIEKFEMRVIGICKQCIHNVAQKEKK